MFDTIQNALLNIWVRLILGRLKFSGQFPVGDTHPVQSVICLLRDALRKYPRWCTGHCLLARQALAVGNYPLVQGSLVAAQTLLKESRSKETSEVVMIRGILALRLGHPDRAIAILSPFASSGGAGDVEIREELAAAYVAIGDKTKAIEILRSIPVTKLSPMSRVLVDSAMV